MNSTAPAWTPPRTATRVYWLVSGTRPGKRLQTVPGFRDATSRSRNPLSPLPPKKKNGPDHFASVVEAKPRSIYFPGLKNGETENFFGPLISTAPAVQTLEVRHIHPGASGNAELEVTLQGVNSGTHVVHLALNGTGVGQVVFDHQNQWQATLPVSPSLLQEGINEVSFTAAGGAEDYSLIDRVRLTYPRSYKAHSDRLRFTAPGGLPVTLSGFSHPVRVMDITEPGAYYQVQGKPTVSGADHGATFIVPGHGLRTCLAFTDPGAPAALYPNQPSAWHRGPGADLVMIGYGELLRSLQPLKAFREGQGYAVALIDVEDLYDEFKYGRKSPQAIKDFLSSPDRLVEKAPFRPFGRKRLLRPPGLCWGRRPGPPTHPFRRNPVPGNRLR